MPLILKVVPFVAFAIGPVQCAESMHLIIDPLALIYAPIDPLIGALALDIILLKLPAILVSICPSELTKALLHAVSIVTLETASIGPLLNPSSILRIIEPLAAVE